MRRIDVILLCAFVLLFVDNNGVTRVGGRKDYVRSLAMLRELKNLRHGILPGTRNNENNATLVASEPESRLPKPPRFPLSSLTDSPRTPARRFGSADESRSSFGGLYSADRTKYLRNICSRFQGTRWCGRGNIARDDTELGAYEELDGCCRAHDHCEDYIRPRSKKYGLYNGYICRRCVRDRRAVGGERVRVFCTHFHFLQLIVRVRGAILRLLGTDQRPVRVHRWEGVLQKVHAVLAHLLRRGGMREGVSIR